MTAIAIALEQATSKLPTRDQAQAATDSKVTSQLASRDDTDTVIYKGESMSRKDAQRLIDNESKPVDSNYAYYDPLDTVELIKNPLLKAMVLGSLEWNMSVAIVRKARDTFFSLRKANLSSENTIDEFNDFVNHIAALNNSAQFNLGWGFEENTDVMNELSIMCSVRRDWYDAADKAHGVANMAYKFKTFVELMHEEKLQLVEGDTKAKLDALASFAGGDNPEDVSTTRALLYRQQEHKFEESLKLRRAITPAALRIIQMAEYHQHDVAPSFYHLPVKSQQQFVHTFDNIINKTLTTLTTWRGIDAVQFATGILPDARVVRNQLAAVLASPKFN